MFKFIIMLAASLTFTYIIAGFFPSVWTGHLALGGAEVRWVWIALAGSLVGCYKLVG